MPTRRSLLQSLAVAPLALLALPKKSEAYYCSSEAMLMPRDHIKTTIEPVFVPKQPRHLPIGCDLAFSSLQWAIDIGKEYKLGKAKILFIGPENRFIAREMLGVPGKPYSTNNEFNALYSEFLTYEVIRSMPFHTWKLVFEYGVVISEGPR